MSNRNIEGKVSAIITTRNRCNLLARAIESVVNQSYQNIEIIVVDDASTDSTRQVCESYNVKYIYIPQVESRGGNYARNLGIANSSGDYLAFLDDDDYWLPAKIQKQVELIEDKQCGFVYCGMKIENVDCNGDVSYDIKNINNRLCGDLHKRIFVTICTTTSCILLRRSLVDSIGGFDESLGFWQEYELTIRAAQITPIYFVDDYLVVYRKNRFDKNRLTNKYYDWLKAVSYVENKHKCLIDKLSIVYKILHRSLVYRERYNRAAISGLKLVAAVNLLKSGIIYTPYYLYDKIKCKLGYTY